MVRKKSHVNEFFLIAILCITYPSAGQSTYNFESFVPPEGVTHPLAYSMVQDSLGFIWIHHTGGLARYDGYNFKVYNYDPTDSLRSPGKLFDGQLMLDKSGNIWTRNNQWIAPDRTLELSKYDPRIDGFRRTNVDLNGANAVEACFDKTNSTVWLGTSPGQGLFSLDLVSLEVRNYKNVPDGALEITAGLERRNAAYRIIDLGSYLLLGTWDGIWKFDKQAKLFSRPKSSPTGPVISMIEKTVNGNEQIWLVVNKGLTVLSKDLSIIDRVEFPEDFPVQKAGDLEFVLVQLDVDENGVVWVATSNGLYRYNPGDRTVTNLRSVRGDPSTLPSVAVKDVMIDRNQNVWVTTQDRWFCRLRNRDVSFFSYELGNTIEHATSFRAGDQDFLVVGKAVEKTGTTEIIVAPIDSDNLNEVSFQYVNRAKYIKGKVNSLSVGKRSLWVGTWEDGLSRLPLDLQSRAEETEPIVTYTFDVKNPNTISSNRTSGVWEDVNENLWVGTYGNGLNKISLDIPYGSKGSVTRYIHSDTDTNSISNNVVWWDFYAADEKSFFVRTAGGIDLFRDDHFEHVFRNDYATSLNKRIDGTVVVGVLGETYFFESRKVGDQYRFLPSQVKAEGLIYREDEQRRMWIMGMKLSCYDSKDQSHIQFSEKDGYYAPKECLKTPGGIMVFWDQSRITLFDPQSLHIDRRQVFPLLTRLTVNNQETEVGSVLSTRNKFSTEIDISRLNRLTLDYQHNNFTVEFSAMEMTAPEKNLYSHKLEGYDLEWIETDYTSRTATYTNLDPGRYTFRVKATNHHGVWSDNERTLTVVILPPPWQTWWAYSGYALMFVGLLVWARSNIVQRERLKGNLRLAKVEQEKEHFELEKAKEVDKVKSTFFANISHEFRTPLTLIKGPAQELLEEFANHSKVKDRLKVIERNADLVLKLINQLLDLAKLESGTLLVEKSEHDLNKFLQVVVNSFSSLASQKNLSLMLDLPSERHVVSVDKDKVEAILINLINNAIKFTPSGGSVVVRADVTSSQAFAESESTGTPLRRRGDGGEVMTLIVSDTGIGIQQDHHEKIFERFHQVSESHKEVGTGIGLSLAKELVDLMNGSISLKSELAKGSEFTVTLPVEVIRSVIALQHYEKVTAQLVIEEGYASENSHVSPDDKPHILVVEDNSDLRKFIIGSLGTEFNFLEANDGKEGLQNAIDEIPDLIISDIMMPEMDGIMMTGKLKKDPRTSHIPLILLTAKTTDESKLSGLSTGADDYLTKPFNKQELLLKVRNSISLQVRLREKVRLELLKEFPNVEVQSADEKFLLKVKQTILARLSDEQLSVESLAEEVALSRSQLLRKITALTGVSVNELIRTFRLQKAAQLLEQNWGPVTQVAYEVGFSNLSYFSKMFKEQFGVLPSDYLTEGKKSTPSC